MRARRLPEYLQRSRLVGDVDQLDLTAPGPLELVAGHQRQLDQRKRPPNVLRDGEDEPIELTLLQPPQEPRVPADVVSSAKGMSAAKRVALAAAERQQHGVVEELLA